MISKIVTYPHDILINEMPDFHFDNPVMDAKELEKTLIETMLANGGIGLSANQIGIHTKVFSMGHSGDRASATAFFNPQIISASTELNDMVEGCLSFPNIFVKIKRPTSIHAKWQNSNGEWEEATMDGYNAKCFCHEYDHLHGIAMSDRISNLKWQFAVKKSIKLGKINVRTK